MSLSKMALTVTWTWPVTILLLVMVLLPIYAPLMPLMEGRLLPVTSKITFLDPDTLMPLLDANGKQIVPFKKAEDGDILVRFSYTKFWWRQCALALPGVDASRNDQHVDVAPVPGQQPSGTRVPGVQTSQIWRMDSNGTANPLDKLSIYFLHNCNPAWITITPVYP